MKVSSSQILSEVADDLGQYLMQGAISINPLVKKIEPNLKIHDIKKLIRIHFILTESGSSDDIGVIDFIKELNNRIRRIKTTIKPEIAVLNGFIKGKIKWNKTFLNRIKYGSNNLLFTCELKEKDYNISENLVLKKLLQIIYSIIQNDIIVGIEKKYTWLKEWVSETALLEELKRIYLRNIYLKKINLQKIKISPRMIQNAKKSRNPLYREAAFLLSKYQKLMNFEIDPGEVKNLLRNTFIEPDRTEVLFELYWIIKLIKQFKTEDIVFELIEPGRNIISKWKKGEYDYTMYHDSVGSFEFIEKVDELNKTIKDDNYFKREIMVLKKLGEMTSIPKNSLWGGRPDILLEKRKSGNLISVFIGEVKYTNDRSYAIQGLKELLEYIALIKENDQRVEPDLTNLFENLKKIKAGLFIDKIEDLDVSDNEDIKIFMFGDETLFSF